MSKYTIEDFKKEFKDNDDCLQKIFDLRYGDLKKCPKCGEKTEFKRVKGRKCFYCAKCAYQIHPLTNTIFCRSKISLYKWFMAIFLYSCLLKKITKEDLMKYLKISEGCALVVEKKLKNKIFK